MTNLSDLGDRERVEAISILQAWVLYGLPDNFTNEEVNFFFDADTGDIYLTNNVGEYVALTAQRHLERYYYLSPGARGFLSDLLENIADLDSDEREELKAIVQENT